MTEPEAKHRAVDRPEDAGEKTHFEVNTASAMDELASANRASNMTMVSLVEHVRDETSATNRKVAVLEKNNRQTMFLIYLVVAAVLVLIALAVVNAINIASTRDIARSVEGTNRTLLDCANSTGACGRINADNQKVIIDSVKQYNLIGFYCIRTNPGTTDPKGEGFLKCMERLYPGGPVLNGR